MFFFIPIRTEKDTARLPYLTIGLIVLNLVIWIFTQNIVNSQMDELNTINQRLIEIERPYLIQPFKENPGFWEKLSPAEVHAVCLREGLIPLDKQTYQEWKSLFDTFQYHESHMLYNRVGFIPASPNVVQMLTSLFMHGGFLHVFFNMLFLWLVGCNIEDDWKWFKFLAFYLLSGIVACFIHASFSAGSTVPLIGASGAVAGVMGAFLVQHYNAKIRFWYFVWLLLKPRIGTFTVAAYVVLPFWFLQEFFYAQKGFTTGTAHWAHVGGFVFGGIFALVMQYFETRKEESRTIPVPPAESLSNAMTDTGIAADTISVRPETPTLKQVSDLDAFLQREPDNVDARLEMARLIFKRGFQDDAMIHYNRALDSVFETEAEQMILDIFKEVKGLGLHQNFSESNLYRIGLLFDKRGYYKAAVSIFSALIKRFSKSPIRAQAIYRTAHILKDKLQNESLARNAIALLRRDYPDFSPRPV